MPHKILVVDDLPSCLDPLARLLRFHGFEVATAPDGQQAIAAVQDFSPHVVILDLSMPVMDGYGFLEVLRSHPDWTRITVIVLSAEAVPDHGRLKRLGVAKVRCKGSTALKDLIADVVAVDVY